MEHFYHNVEGMFDYANFYKDMVDRSPNPAHFVEVGVYKGRSAAFMAVEIINSGKDIRFDCVDPWDGRAEPGHGYRAGDHTYDAFIARMSPVIDRIRPVKLSSVDASVTYPDESLDFVFIDATHTYDALKEDINAWLPKIKHGGILAGHDYLHGAEFGPLLCEAVKELCPGHYVVNNDPEHSPVWVYVKP